MHSIDNQRVFSVKLENVRFDQVRFLIPLVKSEMQEICTDRIAVC